VSALLAIDVGTSHIKAATFECNGTLIQLALRPTPILTSPAGWRYIEPDALWDVVQVLIQEVVALPIIAIGVTSMAETGILINKATRQPRTPMFPWFDSVASAQAAQLQKLEDPLTTFQRTGLRASFKSAVARLLWLRDEGLAALQGGVWLSAADYVVFRLTGELGTDYSLAGRTLAFDIRARQWDYDWLSRHSLPAMFPDARPAGSVFGQLECAVPNLPTGIPVTIAGHDHICAAYSVGATETGSVLDSMGTAEALVGALEAVTLDQAAFDSGLSFGCHTFPDRFYWIGGTSASGGSVEWLRSLLAESPLSYEQIGQMLEVVPPQPTGIVYAPYLSGAGIPRPDPSVGAAFLGLRREHTRTHLLRAALEGTAYEMEMIRQLAETSLVRRFDDCTVVGGSTRNTHWMQIKADVSGLRLNVCEQPEAPLLGTALLAGVAGGCYSDYAAALQEAKISMRQYIPDPTRHEQYRQVYQSGYLPLQAFLRKVEIPL
jgi:sugar (pentulose or hexulose) kinase